MAPDFFIRSFVEASPKQRCFYHFTDGKNLPLIRRHGILCTKLLEEADVKPMYGGNEISRNADKRFGMDRYVHLCFMKNNSMEFLARNEGRIKDVKYLEIAPSVLHLPGGLITLGVSNGRDVERLPIAEGLDKLDGEVIYRNTARSQEMTARWKFAHKCEILVLDRIPVEYIRNLNDG